MKEKYPLKGDPEAKGAGRVDQKGREVDGGFRFESLDAGQSH